MLARLLGLSCAAAVILLAQSDETQIRGKLVDSGNSSVPALIRIMPKDSTSATLRLRSEFDGSFAIPGIRPGVYNIRVQAPGFRPEVIADVSVRAGQTTDIGVIVLNFAGCDAPGVTCDSVSTDGTFGDPSEKNVVVRPSLKIQAGCGADLDQGIASCLGNDVTLIVGQDKAVYLKPATNVQISHSCTRAKYEQTPLRIDGLGPGDEMCVRTKMGRTAHIFLLDEVPAGATAIRLRCVTRN